MIFLTSFFTCASGWENSLNAVTTSDTRTFLNIIKFLQFRTVQQDGTHKVLDNLIVGSTPLFDEQLQMRCS
eukprot:m.426594 g.426594  ORF g.426594 m.426594 type:complete len:71 (-) comp21356_c1_seq7:2132-2344(-)